VREKYCWLAGSVLLEPTSSVFFSLQISKSYQQQPANSIFLLQQINTSQAAAAEL